MAPYWMLPSWYHTSTHRRDKDYLIPLTKRGICGYVDVIDCTDRAVHDGLQAWIEGEEQCTHIGDASSFVHYQYFLILSNGFTERGKIAHVNLHRSNIAYSGQRYEARSGTYYISQVVLRIFALHLLNRKFKASDTPPQIYWSSNVQSILDREARQ